MRLKPLLIGVCVAVFAGAAVGGYLMWTWFGGLIKLVVLLTVVAFVAGLLTRRKNDRWLW